MKTGYKVVWTDHALDELRRTFSHIEQNFSEREVRRLAIKIETTLQLIVSQPALFPESPRRKGVRRAVILQLNSMYYRVKGNQIEVLSFFANRQDPGNTQY